MCMVKEFEKINKLFRTKKELIAEILDLQKSCEIQSAALTEMKRRLRAKDSLLHDIACLGNGNEYGNSEGNVLAIKALEI